MSNTEKTPLISIKDLHVKFRVRGRELHAIRGVSMDFYENESVAIVGESGSGKSVFTKTFSGMLEENGFVSDGSILFHDDELSEAYAPYGKAQRALVRFLHGLLNRYSRLELGSVYYREILQCRKRGERCASLEKIYRKAIRTDITASQRARNEVLAKEIYLCVARYHLTKRTELLFKLVRAFRDAMRIGLDLSDGEVLNQIFDTVAFRVQYIDEEAGKLHGRCIIDLAKIRYHRDWMQIRGSRIATVFQDPMTSLNPIVTIGKQIVSVIIKHQGCSEAQARERALELMRRVGIPDPEARFDDYPFQYSGGMRQRIVIAIALCCRPRILICDEPTTALDVTIQAQILKLLKDLQRELHFTIIFITHDLGVVANIADRVAVLYAGQIVELGRVEEVFYDPRHPYTWALLSSLPQLAQREGELYSITGTPPSLYNRIVGDAFAPRNPYCLKIDTLKDAPMFDITETHSAKTWLLDPRAAHIEKPQMIANIHERLMEAFNI